MKIAILGGSFNPPHLGHLTIAREVKKHLQLDEIWLMPCANHPFGKKLLPSFHRLKMTKFLEKTQLKFLIGKSNIIKTAGQSIPLMG